MNMLSRTREGRGYRWPFGRPGPALARARPSPFFNGPCLARPNCAAGRAVPAHGLPWRPRHEPTGHFCAGPARNSPAQQHRSGGPRPNNTDRVDDSVAAGVAAAAEMRRRQTAGGDEEAAAGAAEPRMRWSARRR